jgi:hypothetical protein
MDSPIAAVPFPSEEEVTALEAALCEVVTQTAYAIGRPNRKTVCNLLRAARISVAATPEQVAAFVAEKLQYGSSRFGNWRPMYKAVVEDFRAWKECLDTNEGPLRGPAGSTPEAEADLREVQDYLEQLREQVMPSWPPANGATVRRIARAVRVAEPGATPLRISFHVRDRVYGHHLQTWGGVVASIRDNW